MFIHEGRMNEAARWMIWTCWPTHSQASRPEDKLRVSVSFQSFVRKESYFLFPSAHKADSRAAVRAGGALAEGWAEE